MSATENTRDTSDNGNKDKVVLVTGINGYIASHVGLQLLQKGYTVRGTSRAASAQAKLLAGPFKGFESQYQHVQVVDIVAPGAFDAAVQGVHAIVHTASPVDFTLTTVDDFFRPAVGGIQSILASASTAAGPQLRSFVVTSSVAAIIDRWRQPVDHAYSEADWNTTGESVARREFAAQVAYGASKAAAERAVWDWMQQHQHQPGTTVPSSSSFSVTAVNPAVVTGPPVLWPATPDQLNETLLPVWRIWSGDKTMPAQIGGAGYIDVRDVARMHVWAVENPERSHGQRYMMANGKAPPQAAADLLRTTFPDKDILLGNPGHGYSPADYGFLPGESSLVSTKALDALGLQSFIRYDQSILDTVDAFERQWPGYAQNFKPKQ